MAASLVQHGLMHTFLIVSLSANEHQTLAQTGDNSEGASRI